MANVINYLQAVYNYHNMIRWTNAKSYIIYTYMCMCVLCVCVCVCVCVHISL